ncbi:MAG TPA: TIGR03435 family protein [Bryobacteraceae bacterium]|nr:TIGR03435 family protein [Bryobacteraceae bacterium]
MTRRLGFAAIFLVLAAFGQPAARFEVASVKKAESGGPPGDIPRNMDPSPGHFAMRNVPMRYMMEWAYNLHDYELAGPEWIKSDDHYDIFARAPGPANDDQMRIMLQALLRERFQMKVHRETRDMPAYLLMPGKGPAKVTKSAADSQPRLIPGKNTEVTFQHFPLSRLTFLLTRRMDHPVLDATGLSGDYDYTIDLSGLAEFSGRPTDPDQNVTSIFAAVERDLGLKLEARKQQPIAVLVIDAVNRVPTEN